jgi:osmotically-inducible protein OsmY
MTDDELRRDVAAELAWEPRAGDAISVTARAGHITLCGLAQTVRERAEAGRAAARVRGVASVDNQVLVRPPAGDPARDDAELRGDVLNALMLDRHIPMTVEARARDGLVTLTGAVDWHFQRAEAEFLASNVPGVTAIRNEITVGPVPARGNGSAGADGVAAALRRSALLDASKLSVRRPAADTVTLTGTVRSRAERDAAVAAAWSATGVTRIVDRISVQG